MTGRCSTRARMMSKDKLPEPVIIDERNSTTGTAVGRRTSPTSWRLRKCDDRLPVLSPSLPQIHDRCTPASLAAEALLHQRTSPSADITADTRQQDQIAV